jgi:hypothetical protein
MSSGTRIKRDIGQVGVLSSDLRFRSFQGYLLEGFGGIYTARFFCGSAALVILLIVHISSLFAVCFSSLAWTFPWDGYTFVG